MEREIKLNIGKIQILHPQHGADIILIRLNGDSPYPNLGDPGYLEIKTAQGYAEKYLNKLLGIQADEIIKV